MYSKEKSSILISFFNVDDFHPLVWTFCSGDGGFVVVDDFHPLDWIFVVVVVVVVLLSLMSFIR